MRRDARSLLLFLAVLLGAAGCDHATKQVAISILDRIGGVSVVGDAIRLELASNPGAFLSLGAGLPEAVRTTLLMGVVPLLALGFATYVLYTCEPTARLMLGIGLVLGGGLGNWLDRLLHGGAVTDFITVGWGALHTGVFNIADVAVVAGMVVLFFGRASGAGASRSGQEGSVSH